VKRLWGPFIFCIMAGLAIVMTTISGHTRIATFEFPCLIIIGTLLFFALGRNRTTETAATTNKESKSTKVFRFFGWLLLAGVLLQVILQIQRTLIDHQQFQPGIIIEYVIELALVYFLMRPNRNRAN